MKKSTFNPETAKTLAKVAAGFTTQKVLGTLHLTVQTGADVLQAGANAIAHSEATILTKLDLYNESFEELKEIRKERTKAYQKLIRKAPEKLTQISIDIKDKLSDLIINKEVKPLNK